jgi:hypothetical protein
MSSNAKHRQPVRLQSAGHVPAEEQVRRQGRLGPGHRAPKQCDRPDRVRPPTRSSHHSEGGFGIIAPLDLPAQQRAALIEEQLIGLAQAWGYICVDHDSIRASDGTGRPAQASPDP